MAYTGFQALHIQPTSVSDTPAHTTTTNTCSTTATESNNSHVNHTGPSSSSSTNHTNGHSLTTRHRSRGLSLNIADIVSSSSSARNNSTDGSNMSSSSSQPPTRPMSQNDENVLSIHIEDGKQFVLRPNRIVRGYVVLNAARAMQVSRIRIKFRAEEVATVKVREASVENRMERIDQMTTTYFEVDGKVWGKESSEFSFIPWDTLEPGEHRFPFALKFCNVNFPPSIDDPIGFSINYIWTAHLDGPGFHPGLRSRRYIVPYRPIICAPLPEPWTFSKTVHKSDSKYTPLAHVKAILPQQVFCPDDPFEMNLEVECIPSDTIVTNIAYTFKKHYEGKLRLQQGTVFKTAMRPILQNSVGVPGNDGTIQLPVCFKLPTRQVSPSFASQHIRVYYSLVLCIACESAGRLLKKSTTHHVEVAIPIAIANLPYDHLLRVANLTAIQSYRTSKASPIFFDPLLDEPPATPLPGILQDTPLQSPPNYFSLPTMPPQLQSHQRVEKTVFTSRSIRPGQVPELGDPGDIAEVFDDEW